MLHSIIDDENLAQQGAEKMPWFRACMPILRKLNNEFIETKPFSNLVIAVCFHLEPKTAFWMESMLAGGAEHIYIVGNLGTTKPETAAYLASLDRVTVLGKKADSMEEHQSYLDQVLSQKIDLFLDNGASLILAYHRNNPKWIPKGATEETRSGKLLIENEQIDPKFPVIVVDDSPVKWQLENAIGVGQSVVDGFMRATSLLIGGKNILIIGYGHCGSGVTEKFRAMGANTMVYDVDPVLLLKARADGNRVGELNDLLECADVIVTVTGRFNVITHQHINIIKNGAILANAGHYGFEIDRLGILTHATSYSSIRPGIEEIVFDSKKIYLLEKANPLNLSAADGNPIEIMDIGLGLQAACARKLAIEATSLRHGLQHVPEDINRNVSRISLDSQSAGIFQ